MKSKTRKSGKPSKAQEETPPKKDFADIATTIGKYLLAIAAIAAGVQALISRWPVKSPESPADITANDFCPQFIQGVPNENIFIYVLGMHENKTPDLDQRILIRFLDQTDAIGYIRFSYLAQKDAFLIDDVTNEKCVGVGISNIEMPNNGELLEIEFREQKKYNLYLKIDTDTGVLQFELQE